MKLVDRICMLSDCKSVESVEQGQLWAIGSDIGCSACVRKLQMGAGFSDMRMRSHVTRTAELHGVQLATVFAGNIAVRSVQTNQVDQVCKQLTAANQSSL